MIARLWQDFKLLPQDVGTLTIPQLFYLLKEIDEHDTGETPAEKWARVQANPYRNPRMP